MSTEAMIPQIAVARLLLFKRQTNHLEIWRREQQAIKLKNWNTQ